MYQHCRLGYTIRYIDTFGIIKDKEKTTMRRYSGILNVRHTRYIQYERHFFSGLRNIFAVTEHHELHA